MGWKNVKDASKKKEIVMNSKQVVLMFLAALSLFLAPRHMYGQKQQGPILIPAKTKLSLELLSPLSTATSKKGDKFSCKVLSPAELIGATVSGYVRQSKRSAKVEGKSEMELGFESITLPDGRVGSFNASVTEVFDVVDAAGQGKADTEGTVRAKSTVKRDMLKIGVGAAIGAVIGGILGGGPGAAVGAAIGAGVGITTTIATKGPDLEFKQGTQFTVVLNSPSRQQQIIEPPVIVAKKPEAPAAPVIAPPVVKEETKGNEVRVSAETAKTAEAKPVTAAPVLKNPRPPSERYRLYTGNSMFQLSVPANWRESSITNPVTFAPDGGRLLSQDKFVLTHGAMTGVSQTTEKDLVKATEQFISTLLQSRAYLSRQRECQSSSIAGQSALSCSLAGLSNVTGRMERVAVYAALLNDVGLYYLVVVAPDDELPKYQAAFQSIRSSVKFNIK